MPRTIVFKTSTQQLSIQPSSIQNVTMSQINNQPPWPFNQAKAQDNARAYWALHLLTIDPIRPLARDATLLSDNAATNLSFCYTRVATNTKRNPCFQWRFNETRIAVNYKCVSYHWRSFKPELERMFQTTWLHDYENKNILNVMCIICSFVHHPKCSPAGVQRYTKRGRPRTSVISK